MKSHNNLALVDRQSERPQLIVVNQFSDHRRMNVQKSMSQMFLKTITIFLLLSVSNWLLGETRPAAKTVREAAIEKAVAKLESRHFELHSFYIPPTQGNLQWLVTSVGAKPDEAVLVWKLMRDWEARRATALSSGRTPAVVETSDPS